MSFQEVALSVAADKGFEIGSVSKDPRLDEPAFSEVAKGVKEAVRVDIESGAGNGRLVLWQTAEADVALSAASALGEWYDAHGDKQARYHISGPNVLALEEPEGFSDPQAITNLLISLVP